MTDAERYAIVRIDPAYSKIRVDPGVGQADPHYTGGFRCLVRSAWAASTLISFLRDEHMAVSGKLPLVAMQETDKGLPQQGKVFAPADIEFMREPAVVLQPGEEVNIKRAREDEGAYGYAPAAEGPSTSAAGYPQEGPPMRGQHRGRLEENIVVLHLNTLPYIHRDTGKAFYAPYEVIVLDRGGRSIYHEYWHAFAGDGSATLVVPNDLGVSPDEVGQGHFFVLELPALAARLSGRIVVCHVLKQKCVPLRTRIHAYQVRDVGRVSTFEAALGQTRGKGEASSLERLAWGILQMEKPVSIEAQARAILNLYEYAQMEMEREAGQRPRYAIPTGLGATTLVSVDSRAPFPFFIFSPLSLGNGMRRGR